jgi:RNA polymerase sigma factor (sigma-70 family)
MPLRRESFFRREHSNGSMDNTATMTADPRRRFGDLLEQHRGIVLKVAATYCRHPDDRADLAQEIAAQLWRAWPAYDDARSFSTWMYRIALNVAISFVRSDGLRRRHAVPLDESMHDVPADDAGHEDDERVRLLRRFIATLEPLDRALLLLYLEERSQREIADILGIGESNVSTKIHRLKQRLRERYA